MIGLQFGVLGPLQVVRDGKHCEPGSFKQRSLLALLLIHRNEVVSTDRLIAELWGKDASSDRQNALWVHISNLRSVLEPDRSTGSTGTILLTRAPGYVLEVGEKSIDSHRFEKMLEQGRMLLDNDPESASRVLSDALGMWRGRAFEDFTYESFAQTEISRLEELRTETVETRAEADLRRGMAGELVSELEALVKQHPLRERFVSQLMLALYRSGRQAEALRKYAALKERLGGELGIEPSAELKRLEERILLSDPELLVAAGERRDERKSAIRGYELREEIGSGSLGVVYRAFQPGVGREVAIKVVEPSLADDPDFIRRFEAQARAVARLEHPNIVPIYDYWREPGGAFLVMRLMQGGDLASVAADSSLDPGRAASVVGHIADAVAAAHQEGLVHGGIKPANVLFDQEGRAYLSDLGLTIEAAEGRAGLSVERDISDLGSLLWEALNGSARGDDPETRSLLDIARRAMGTTNERYPDVAAFSADLSNAGGLQAVPTEVAVENPYKGLRPFEETDAATFFGRERLVERLINHLGRPDPSGRLLGLVGPSGSGKSSAIKAGLLPALRSGALPSSEKWYVVEMTPGGHPFQELEKALLRVAVDPPSTILEQLESDARGLRRVIDRILPDDRSQLVLLIDQFEELFTLTEDRAARRRFLDALRVAISASPARLRMVMTLRADFYDRPLQYHDFGELLRNGTEVITPMSPEELERAVSGPAESVGIALEPGLAAAIVSEVADEASALPLVQYAMTELFDRRQGGMLTIEAHRSLGGVAGALGRRAEELFELLESEERDAAWQVFLQLVTLGEGEEDTRRRVLVAELHELGQAHEAVDQVLEVYGRHRLLSFDRDPVSRSPTVEVAHEALLREWPRYQDWIEEARDDVRYRRRLASAANEWRRHGEDLGYLLSGSRLSEAEAWRESTDLALTELESAFVAESSQRAATERQTLQRRRRTIAVVLGAAAALALSFLVFGLTQRSAADRIAAIEQINGVIAAAENALSVDPERALLFGARAAEETLDLGLEVFPSNLAVLHDGLRVHRLLFTVEEAASAAFAPDGDLVYVSHDGGLVSIRDATSGDELDSVTLPPPPVRDRRGTPPMPLDVSGDGRWLTTGYSILDTEEMEAFELTWPEDRLGVRDVAISGDGGTVALAHGELGRETEGSVALWDPRQQRELWSHELAAPREVEFSPGETILAATINGGTGPPDELHLFDAASGEEIEVIALTDPLGISFTPDGSHLVVGDAGPIRYWSIEDRAFVNRVDGGHQVTVPALDFGAGGRLLVSGDIAGDVIIRDGETGDPLYPLPDHGRAVIKAALSADGERLLTVTEEGIDIPGRLRVFNTGVGGGRDERTIPTSNPLPATIDVSPSGTLMAVGSHGNGVREIRDTTGQIVLSLPAHVPFPPNVGIAGPIAFSPEAETIATGDARGQVRLFDANTGEELISRDVRDMVPEMGDTLGEPVFAVGYSPDGTKLAIGGAGFVVMAEANTLDDAVLLHEDQLTFTKRVAFSPDGTRLIASRAKGVDGTQDDIIPVVVSWDVESGEVLNSFEHRDRSLTTDYSSAGDLVAVGTMDVTVLEADTFQPMHVFESTHGEVRDVVFSPDGAYLAAGYDDGALAIWDAETGRLQYELEGHEMFVFDIEWTDDGSRLMSVGADDTIRIYAMDPVMLIDLTRSRVTRALTDTECRQYLGVPDCG